MGLASELEDYAGGELSVVLMRAEEPGLHVVSFEAPCDGAEEAVIDASTERSGERCIRSGVIGVHMATPIIASAKGRNFPATKIREVRKVSIKFRDVEGFNRPEQLARAQGMEGWQWRNSAIHSVHEVGDDADEREHFALKRSLPSVGGSVSIDESGVW